MANVAVALCSVHSGMHSQSSRDKGMQKVNKRRPRAPIPRPLAGVDAFFSFFPVFGVLDRALFLGLLCVLAREQRARMDVDEPTARAVGGEILPMIFVVSKAIEYIKNQILDRVVSHRRLLDIYVFMRGYARMVRGAPCERSSTRCHCSCECVRVY